MSVTTADFLPDVLMVATGLADFLAERYIVEAINKFAQQTGCLECPAEIDLSAGEYEGFVMIERNTETPYVLREVKRDDGFILQEVSTLRQSTGVPTTYRWDGLVIMFNCVPAVNLTLTATSINIPKRGATSFHDSFKDTYYDGVIAGTLERALMTRGNNNQWFEPNLAQYYANQFREQVRIAKAQKLQYANQHVKPVRFV